MYTVRSVTPRDMIQAQVANHRDTTQAEYIHPREMPKAEVECLAPHQWETEVWSTAEIEIRARQDYMEKRQEGIAAQHIALKGEHEELYEINFAEKKTLHEKNRTSYLPS